jgi:hypothetical protein
MCFLQRCHGSGVYFCFNTRRFTDAGDNVAIGFEHIEDVGRLEIYQFRWWLINNGIDVRNQGLHCSGKKGKNVRNRQNWKTFEYVYHFVVRDLEPIKNSILIPSWRERLQQSYL